MAISQRLTRKFQQTLGNEPAEDLVRWMDHVDTRGEEVRDLIAQVREWREASRADFAELRQEMHAGFARGREDLTQAVHALELADANLRTELANVRADLLKWSFLFWVTTLGAVVLSSLR
jgi:hypothetical protein